MATTQVSKERDVDQTSASTQPLSPIETWLDCDNRSSHPLDFFLRLRFEGTLCEERLRQALDDALVHHPMLLRQLTGKRNPGWDWSCQPSQVVTMIRSPAVDIQGIDLTEEPGVRCFLEDTLAGVILTFQFHHVCTDGLGAAEFLSDVLACYRDQSDEAICRDPQLLDLRHRFGFEKESVLKRIRRLIGCAPAPALFLTQTPAALKIASDQSAEAALECYPNWHSVTLTKQQTEELRQQAVGRGTSTNTLLLANFFRVLSEYRRQQPDYRPAELLRVTVPCNMRTREHRLMPAANMFSMAFPTFRMAQVGSDSDLIRRLDNWLQSARQFYYLQTLLVGMRVAKTLRQLMNSFTRADCCQSTALLTNLGRVLARVSGGRTCHFACDGLKLLDVSGIPPLRPHQTVSVAVMQYAEQISLTFAYDSRVHSSSEVSAMLRDMIRHVCPREDHHAQEKTAPVA